MLEIILVRSLIQAFFARKEKLRKCGTFSLDFLGFPGNPRIKEEPASARNPSCQKLQSFLHIRKSPQLGHSWHFQAFS